VLPVSAPSDTASKKASSRCHLSISHINAVKQNKLLVFKTCPVLWHRVPISMKWTKTHIIRNTDVGGKQVGSNSEDQNFKLMSFASLLFLPTPLFIYKCKPRYLHKNYVNHYFPLKRPI
jgi:hypothetical protein